MTLFPEYQSASRDLRVRPLHAQPLPRLTAAVDKGVEERYEVVIVGAGPAGLFLELLLARYGLSDDALLCIDSKPAAIKSGQADGLQPRTLEVLTTLGLANEILTQGCQMWEVAFWNPTRSSSGNSNMEAGGESAALDSIERTSIVMDCTTPARYTHEVTIHQGRIERILEDDLRIYSARGVVRSSKLISVSIVDETDDDFPVEAEIEHDGRRRKVRAKHLVGADGAHSTVRQAVGLKLQGETTDHLWGVVDCVVDTDFPDIRRRTAIHSSSGSVMVIPRELTNDAEYLTRLYIQIEETVLPEEDQVPVADAAEQKRDGTRRRRSDITLEDLFRQVERVFHPYQIRQKVDTDVDWWTVYQIGQRIADSFVRKDAKGTNRVFIVGDACHTHSPKAGQGMNVSMMDSYNLSWKLIHSLNGLSPGPDQNMPANPVLDTYHIERHNNARQLIDFDKRFSSMFSGKLVAGSGEDGSVGEGLTHEQFLDVFNTGNGFTTGCGIEYPENIVVQQIGANAQGPVVRNDYHTGCLRPGRRLLDTMVTREGSSALAVVELLGTILPKFPRGTIEPIVLHPLDSHSFVWQDLPPVLKACAEMRFHGRPFEGGYEAYGVDADRGASAVIRPDGYVGVVANLSDTGRIEEFLVRCLRTV
ncbi:MAG: hypothetical protein M1833_003204 [Piccolia ochrophora]|nr:MAG: hypothetical protein M1833_003204 [Piccolia ochrophora]